MRSRLIGSVFIVVLFAAPAFAGDDVPAWLQQAAGVSAPVYKRDVPAVELLREEHVTVAADGRVTTVTNYAMRVLIHEGRDYAMVREYYASDAGKVKEIHAWLIRSSGTTKKYGKDDVVDAVEDPNDVYNESRFKMIDGSKDADTGAVFGYQTVTEEHSIFSQHLWSSQHRLPALMSRYTLTLPEGWHASSVTFNHAKIEPAVSGTTYTWELRDLYPIEPEPNSPAVSSLAARVAVSYFPPGDTPPTAIKTFANWTEVSHWLSELQDPQATPNDAIAGKVKQLTGDSKTELEKIRAIARFVQDIRYISIDIGVSRGGGMRPHTAAEVFAKGYGDCKDKANLMRAMLKVLNITSYPVGIFSGDANYVREEWSSPEQFNHCIIAIKVNDGTQTPTVLIHPKLGRLLIFDATDDNTPVGDLPEDEQGSFAVIVAGDAGGLVRMPITPPEANGLTRRVEASLEANGSLNASIHENSTGSQAVSERGAFRHETHAAYVKMIEGWVARGAAGATVSKVEPKDNTNEGRFELDVDFNAPSYGQLMQDRLLVFKPAVVSRRETLFLTDAKRKHPIVLDARAFTEQARVKLPAGWAVDELPDPVKLETSFGSYQTTYEVKEGVLVFSRTMSVRTGTIPADQYESVRQFYERIRTAEQAPVVLAKK
jgi:hypothetical protein